ncbi:MAG: hypothetical protein CMJ31_07210 [Phycisphaerae bacterium]|nr:hypothetical protein [Phycisphaerae bacterium]
MSSKKTTLIHGIAIAAAAGLVSSASAGVVLVDDFSTGEIDISTRSAEGTLNDALANVLGGERELSWDIVQNPFNSRLNIFAAFEGTPGLGIDMGAGNASVVNLRYDGVGTEGGAAGLGFDAIAEGTQSVRMTFLTIDLETDVTVTLTDGSGLEASLTRFLAPGLASIEFFALNDFDIDAGFDFSDIFALDVDINLISQEPNRDLFLSDIQFDMEVPSPGSMALIGIGGLALAGRRRR